jgi:hypothetical protein
MLRWIIVIAMLALIFSSCNKCKLETQETLQIYYSQPVIHNNGSWSSMTPVALADYILGDVRSQFREPKQLQLVQNNARYIVSIDSINGNSEVSTETVGDPCWKSQGWLYDQFHPQSHSTYTLNSASVAVYFTITDTLTHLTKNFYSYGYGGEYLNLPPADSVNCYGYEVKGQYSKTDLMDKASQNAYCDFKCIIKDWLQ